MKQKELSSLAVSQLCQELSVLLHAGILLGDGLALLAREEGGGTGRLLAEIGRRVDQGEALSSAVRVEQSIYSYTCPISETRQLLVALEKDGEHWTVLRWQAVSTAPWEGEESLNVWDGT